MDSPVTCPTIEFARSSWQLRRRAKDAKRCSRKLSTLAGRTTSRSSLVEPGRSRQASQQAARGEALRRLHFLAVSDRIRADRLRAALDITKECQQPLTLQRHLELGKCRLLDAVSKRWRRHIVSVKHHKRSAL